MAEYTYKVQQDDIGIRLDKLISIKFDDFSRVTIQRLIENGKIKVNEKEIKVSYKVQENDFIKIEEEEIKDTDLIPENIPLDVIYEDNDILVVNKEKGMVVHPGNGNPNGTLVNAVLSRCKESLSGIGGQYRPGIVHRIDKDTSGLLIIAKNDKAHLNVSEQIKNHEVKKTYVALVRGRIKENEATINMAVRKDGKEAITHIKVLKKYNNFTFIEVNIETGRTHQIRVHMAEIGYPIVGDYIYSNGKNPFNVKGQMLHSMKLEFKHPATGKEMSLEAPIPKYFQDVLNVLDKEVE